MHTLGKLPDDSVAYPPLTFLLPSAPSHLTWSHTCGVGQALMQTMRWHNKIISAEHYL